MKGRRIFKEQTERMIPRYNSTRWWSLWECAKIAYDERRHVSTFSESIVNFAESSHRKLSETIAQNPEQLRVDLAALMELKKFVKATYNLEGDGTFVFIAYEELEELRDFIRVRNFPTLTRKVQSSFS